MPRATMSVATRMLYCRERKPAMARSRCACDRLPWRPIASRPAALNCAASRRARCLVRVKTMAESHSLLASRCRSRSRLRSSSTDHEAVVDGRRRRRVGQLADMGLVQQFVGQTADLARHGRREEQVLPVRRQRRQDLANPRQEAHVEHVVGLVEHQRFHVTSRSSRCSIRSSTRPGQPTMISGRPRSSASCRAARRRRRWRRCAARCGGREPNACRICSASSRVGAMTRARTRRGRPIESCSIGSAKAAVLPVPVCARPIRSRPAMIGGIVCSCIGVGSS